MGKLLNVAGGAVTLFLGLILWILFSALGGTKAGLGRFDPTLYAAMSASFFLMIFGPVLFWIALPLIGRYRRRREIAVAGLIVLIVGVTLFFVPPTFLLTSQPSEVWEARTGDMYKELVYRVPGWQNDSWIIPYAGPLILEDAKDFLVEGTIEEMRGRVFNFYVFDPSNHEFWKARMPYTAYVEIKGMTHYSFEFRPSKDDYGGLRFVVENPNPAPIFPEPPELVFKLSATIGWQEKSLTQRLVPLAGADVLGMLGVFVALIGIVLVVAGGIVHLARKVRPVPQAPIPTPAPPLQVTAPAPTAIKRCPHCGAALTGTEGIFCHKCWTRIR